MKKTSHVFSVTHLFNLDVSEAGLKRYSKILRERVSGALLSNSEKKFRVEASFRVFKDLALTEFDHDSITVEVFATPINENDSEEEEIEAAPQPIFCGLLVCMGLTKKMADIAQLPVLVVYKSKKSLEDYVNHELEVN